MVNAPEEGNVNCNKQWIVRVAIISIKLDSNIWCTVPDVGQIWAGVLTIHATHRDLLLTGYAHVQTHRFFLFLFFYKRYIFLL